MENCGCARLLVLLFFIDLAGCVQVDLATGKNHTFLSKATGKIDSIEWRHKDNLVYEVDFPSNETWYRYRERAWINKNTGDLSLIVTKEDNGVFLGKFQVNGVLHTAEYTVTLFDPVSKPKVICEMINSTYIILKCSVDPPVQAAFSWTGPNGFAQSGENIHITRTGDENSVYYCTVSNKVSRNTTEFNLKDCKPNGGPEPKPPVAAIVCGCLAGLAAIAAGVYYKIKGFTLPDFLKKSSDKNESPAETVHLAAGENVGEQKKSETGSSERTGSNEAAKTSGV